ncbi:MAG: phosphoglycerate kinase, partial [Oligoflexales bacterium]|nr:phosphoglycerate kinase [Oligoflexales bacterium]
MKLRKLENLDVKNKKVFLRLDLNVPISGGKISDETRIIGALPTIRHLLDKEAKLVLCSHLGRPKDTYEAKYSLEPVASRLAELLKVEVLFVPDYTDGELVPMLDNLRQGQLILLENLRFHPEETKNDLEFSARLARPFDFYVDDAFGAVHRAHASIVGVAENIPKDRRAAGFLIEKEVNALAPLLGQPKPPFVVIMGGAKVSDKITVILNLMERANTLLIGGAMAYTFLHYQGKKIGKSKIEADKMDLIEAIYKVAQQRHVEICLPIDHLGAEAFDAGAPAIKIKDQDIPDHLMGLDIGEKTIELFSRKISAAATVLWNGPMGVFEWDQFAKGSEAIARALSEA